MDSLSQVVLGAAVGEAVAGKKSGNKAVFWGAVAGTLPDLDAIAGTALSMETVDKLLFHRGASHSVALAVVVSLLVGPLLDKLHQRDKVGWQRWAWLVFLCMVTHALLDCFTTWGTELFWPFWGYRVEIGSIFVIDPLYTVPFLVCLVWLMFYAKDNPKRQRLNTWGLAMSSAYLALTLVNKLIVGGIFEEALQRQGIVYTSYTTAPLPFNNVLWRVNARSADGYYIGYYSYFDKQDISFVFYPRNEALLKPLRGINKVEQLLDITKHEYTVERQGNTYRINDLRFGQTLGWKDPTSDFTFCYVVTPIGADSVVVVQAPMSAKVDAAVLREFGQRVLGQPFLSAPVDTVASTPL